MLAPGVLVERYEIVSPIGEGGMASVWAARQHGKHGFEKLVALKVIHSRYAEDPTFRTMFLDEARLVASLHHRNVAQVFDLGDTGEILFIVLEYVDGESLHALTAPQRTVPLPIALRIVADACAGLAAVHALTDPAGVARNIVHRDVSPQNILFTMSGEVKLIDFGIAKARDRASKTTDINTVKGKLRYMAPEQAKHQALGPSTDVFALGSVLFRMLAGVPPYAATNDLVTIQALLANGPALNHLPADVPPEVVAIVQQSIAPESRDRFLSASAMKEAVESILAAEARAPDVAAWVSQNLSEHGRQRQAILATRLSSTPSMRAAAIAAARDAPKPSAPPITQAMPSPAIPSPAVPAPVVPAPVVPAPVVPAPVVPAPVVPAPVVLAPVVPAPAVPPPAVPPPAVPVPAASPDLASAKGTAPMMPPIRGPMPTPAPAGEQRVPGAPAFMDVHALVAQARAGQIPQTRPATQPHAVPPPGFASPGGEWVSRPGSAQDNAYPSNGMRLDLAVVPLRAAEPPRWGRAPRTALLLLLATAAIAAILLVVPVLVRSRAIAAARAAGFDISVRSAGLGLGGIRLKGVDVRSPSAPGFTATVPEIDTSLSLKEIRLLSPVVRLEGELVDLEVGLGALLEQDRTKYAGTATSPRRFSIVGGSVTWDETAASDTSSGGLHVRAEDVALDVESHGVGTEEVKGSTARTTIQSPRTSLGPWSGSLERSPSAVRVRVAFDPAVADGPRALYVWGSAVPTELTMNVPRNSWSNIGITPADLGLAVDPTSEVEVSLSASVPTTANSTVKLDATIHRYRIRGLAGPVDIHAAGTASGPPDKPLTIDRMNVAAGPFTANVTGSITPYTTGVRLDALFKVTPIGCDKLAKLAGGVAGFVQSLGQTTGIFAVNGTLNASGIVKFDTAAPGEPSVTWLAKESCGVSIFGP